MLLFAVVAMKTAPVPPTDGTSCCCCHQQQKRTSEDLLIDSMMRLSAALIHWFLWDLLVPPKKHLTWYGVHRLLLALALPLLPLVSREMRGIENSTVRTRSSIAAVLIVVLLGCLCKSIDSCIDGNRGVVGSLWSLFGHPRQRLQEQQCTAVEAASRQDNTTTAAHNNS